MSSPSSSARPNRDAHSSPLAESGAHEAATAPPGGSYPAYVDDMMEMADDDWEDLENPHAVIAGRFRLMRLVGEGGMGQVWIAHNEALDIDVAIKLIRADEPGEELDILAERLLQEARAAARLTHPAIVRIHDFGRTESGEPYLAMELLDGEDLATVLRRREPIEPVKAVRYLLPIVHGMVQAHEAGVIHRDIKPANIILARTGMGIQPKLIDFGIARLELGLYARVTRAGGMLGSPLYMAPEQARGGEAGHEADVWAICVVLFEMIGGTTPFVASNYLALARSIIEDPPVDIGGRSGEVDSLLPVLLRGLEKDPARRWPAMRTLGTELARWLDARGVVDDVCGGSLRAHWLDYSEHHAEREAFATLTPPDGALDI